MSDRQRNGLILLIVIGLIAASGVVIAIRSTVLGLDLKGGIELVYRASGTEQQPLTNTTLNEAVQSMEKRVNALGVAQPQIETEGGNLIDVQLPNVSNVTQAENEVGETTRLAFYDWENNVLVPSLSKPGQPVFAASGLTTQDTTSEAISNGGGTSSSTDGGVGLYTAVKAASQQTSQTFKAGTGGLSRTGPEYFLFGNPGSAACTALAAAHHRAPASGTHCLLTGQPIQTAPHQSVTQAIDAAVAEPQELGHPLTAAQMSGTELLTVPQGWVVVQGASASATKMLTQWSDTAKYYVLRDNASLFGNSIRNPQEATGSNGQPSVNFSFTSAGAKAFENVTAAIAQRGLLTEQSAPQGQHFAAVLGSQILTVPSIDPHQYPTGIDASQGSEISGDFTVQTANDLASYLRLGSLPVNLTEISNTTVSATLGSQALHQGLIAGLVGLAVVVIFLLAYYRILGVIAVTGLVAYGVYFFALIKLIPITLTLAGIAGLVLTIGVAADANIVIFERVKEEIRAGRSVRNGIIEGYKKGLSAIVDANVVTIMTAFILFVLATADVKGFAFTLGVGTFVSLFTAIMATQAILLTLGNSRTMARPSALGAKRHHRWTFDFMGASRYFFTLSGVILLIGGFAVAGRGLNLGIDFTGGSQISVGLSHNASTKQIQAVMRSLGEGDATVQAEHDDKALGPYGFQIQAKYLNKDKLATLRSDLNNQFGLRQSANASQDFNPTTVGPSFGSAVTHSAVVAVIISLLLISVYVTLRFDWKYAVPVLIALAHDLLISVGVYALTGRVVTTDTVAALLTILGYSMYDTIIVFDRVRENTKRMPNATFSQILNRSMSEVLTRSLATTFCTLLPVIALLLFGGSTLKDFAFALLVGVASGAYSSIFIASPVLMHWKEREHGYRLRRARILAEDGVVAAYASGAGSDVDPERARRARSGGRLTAPDPEGVSAREFEEMRRDLGLDDETPARSAGRPSARPGAAGAARGARTRPAPGSASRPGGAGRPGRPVPPAVPPPASASDPVPEDQEFEHGEDVSSDDAVLPDQQRPGGQRPRGNRRSNKKHGRR